MSIKMISVRKEQVPEYLKSSTLFENAFQEDDSSCIDVPTDCFKRSPEVHCEADLILLLRTVRFWLIPEYAESSSDLYAFVLAHKECLSRAKAAFSQEFPFLHKLAVAMKRLEGSTLMGNAAKVGLMSLVQYLRSTGHSWDAGPMHHFTSLAAQYGQVNCLQYAVENGCILRGDECAIAAKAGNAGCLKYAHEQGGQITARDCEFAVKGGHLACVKYMIACSTQGTINEKSSTWLCDVAARLGHLHVLQYLHSIGCPTATLTMSHAVLSNHIECLKFLHNSGCAFGPTVLYSAVHSGSIDCVKYLHQHGCPWGAETLHLWQLRGGLNVRMDATFPGQDRLGTFTYAAKNGCTVDPQSFVLAAFHGLTGFVKYLCRKGVVWDAAAVDMAARYNHVACLKYILNHGCPTNSGAYITAIKGNHVDSIQCLHEHGVAWNASISAAAAAQVRPQCLQYLLQHHCPCDVTAYIAAVIAKDGYECVKCLHSHNIPYDVSVLCAAAERNRIRILQFLFQQLQGDLDLSYVAVCAAAIRNNALECLKCALELQCPLDATLPALAAKCNGLPMLTYLHLWRCPWDERTTAAAVSMDNYQCLQYAISKGCPYSVPEELLMMAPRCATFMAHHVRREEKSAKRKATDLPPP